ncbi:hypothetical protein [Arenibacter sp. ARW7G5Y1]|nr:hypothetical protein [Arenibacter sp. ARW7G5Y1]
MSKQLGSEQWQSNNDDKKGFLPLAREGGFSDDRRRGRKGLKT